MSRWKLKCENQIATGLGTGIGAGVAIGVATNQLALWMTLGIVIGIAIGQIARWNKTANWYLAVGRKRRPYGFVRKSLYIDSCKS